VLRIMCHDRLDFLHRGGNTHSLAQHNLLGSGSLAGSKQNVAVCGLSSMKSNARNPWAIGIASMFYGFGCASTGNAAQEGGHMRVTAAPSVTTSVQRLRITGLTRKGVAKGVCCLTNYLTQRTRRRTVTAAHDENE
jgi:hypothetical protein